MKIAHISDLHMTGGNFIPEWGENLLKIISSISPEVLLITGDLTDKGHSCKADPFWLNFTNKSVKMCLTLRMNMIRQKCSLIDSMSRKY